MSTWHIKTSRCILKLQVILHYLLRTCLLVYIGETIKALDEFFTYYQMDELLLHDTDQWLRNNWYIYATVYSKQWVKFERIRVFHFFHVCLIDF